ncbi:MAG: CBS domain-containing protein [Pseudomonadota bacterium]
MNIADILRHKGRELLTIKPDETIAAATRLMAAKRIGAVVVCVPLRRLVGILSERDVIRGVAEHGAAALLLKVEDLMTRDVITRGPAALIKDIMALMTQRRIRHLPVVEGGELVGIVSIGDVVKSRLDEQALETAVLRDLSLTRS